MEYNPQRYFWAVRLRSGEEVWEYCPVTGTNLKIKEVPMLDVKTIYLLPFSEELTRIVLAKTGKLHRYSNVPHYRIDLADGQRPIIYKTQEIRMQPREGQSPRETMYNIGFQETINGKNHKTILSVMEDGSCHVNHPRTQKIPKHYQKLYSSQTAATSDND